MNISFKHALSPWVTQTKHRVKEQCIGNCGHEIEVVYVTRDTVEYNYCERAVWTELGYVCGACFEEGKGYPEDE